jgi:hypothetical protein
VPLFLNLQRVIKGGGCNNLVTMLVTSIHTFGGLFNGDLTSKLVCFHANGVIVFQGLQTRVIMQLTKNMPHLSLTSISWYIGATWPCKQSWAYCVLGKLRSYYSPCFILLTSTWSMGSGRILANKRFEDPLQYQSSMDFHGCTYQMCFGQV